MDAAAAARSGAPVSSVALASAAAASGSAASASSAAPAAFDQRDKFKLVVVGDESVGKTSVITRFMYDSFESTYNVTIGIDFASKNLYLDDRVVRLQVWDTAGQERFRSLIPLYTRDAAAALLIFDLTNRKSFASVTKWIDDVRRGRDDNVLIVLVGNKADLAEASEDGAVESRRMVPTSEALALAAKYKLEYFETSAKTGDEVKPLFQYVAETLVANPPSGGRGERGATIDVTAPPAVTIETAEAGGWCNC